MLQPQHAQMICLVLQAPGCLPWPAPALASDTLHSAAQREALLRLQPYAVQACAHACTMHFYAFVEQSVVGASEQIFACSDQVNGHPNSHLLALLLASLLGSLLRGLLSSAGSLCCLFKEQLLEGCLGSCLLLVDSLHGSCSCQLPGSLLLFPCLLCGSLLLRFSRCGPGLAPSSRISSIINLQRMQNSSK